MVGALYVFEDAEGEEFVLLNPEEFVPEDEDEEVLEFFCGLQEGFEVRLADQIVQRFVLDKGIDTKSSRMSLSFLKLLMFSKSLKIWGMSSPEWLGFCELRLRMWLRRVWVERWVRWGVGRGL